MNLEEIKKNIEISKKVVSVFVSTNEKDAINFINKNHESIIIHLLSIIERHERTFLKIQELCVNAENSQVPFVNLDTIRQVAKVAIDENRT